MIGRQTQLRGAAIGWLLTGAAALAADPTVVVSTPPSAPPPHLDRPVAVQPPVASDPSSVSPALAVSSPSTATPGEYSYNPSGRRDPFAAIIKDGKGAEENRDIPPLQRLSLTELNLIGIVWGGFGYSAMVQAPDGKGYTLKTGTRIGPNNGIVSSITENAIVVQERFTDVYGNKQVREYVKLLHAKEGTE